MGEIISDNVSEDIEYPTLEVFLFGGVFDDYGTMEAFNTFDECADDTFESFESFAEAVDMLLDIYGWSTERRCVVERREADIKYYLAAGQLEYFYNKYKPVDE